MLPHFTFWKSHQWVDEIYSYYCPQCLSDEFERDNDRYYKFYGTEDITFYFQNNEVVAQDKIIKCEKCGWFGGTFKCYRFTDSQYKKKGNKLKRKLKIKNLYEGNNT